MDYPPPPQYPQPVNPPPAYPQPPYRPSPYSYGYGHPPQAYPAPRHSPLGVASFVVALLSALGLFGVIAAVAVIIARRPPGEPREIPEDSPQAIAVGLVLILAVLASLIGLGLGIGGMFQSQRKRLFPVLGACLNGLILLVIIGFIALGLAAA